MLRYLNPRRLIDVQLPERQVKWATFCAASFNIVGMPIVFLIWKDHPSMPFWPEYLSMGVGATIIVLIVSGALKGKTKTVAALFAVNAAAISFAMCFIDSFSDASPTAHLPFQPSKMGALVAGMLAPGFWVGLLSIGFHVVPSVVQFLTFPPEVQAAIRTSEPWALIAFGMGGCFILIHRLRIRQLELTALKARAEAESTRRLAQAFLELRDLMNTPIQSIEIASALIQHSDPETKAVLDRLRNSCERLREISQSLKRYEGNVDWAASRGGLGD